MISVKNKITQQIELVHYKLFLKIRYYFSTQGLRLVSFHHRRRNNYRITFRKKLAISSWNHYSESVKCTTMIIRYNEEPKSTNQNMAISRPYIVLFLTSSVPIDSISQARQKRSHVGSCFVRANSRVCFDFVIFHPHCQCPNV